MSIFFFACNSFFFLSRRLKLTFQTLEFDIGTTVIIINYQQCWSIFTFRKKLVNFSLEFHSKKKKDICWWFFFLDQFSHHHNLSTIWKKSFLSEPLNFRGLYEVSKFLANFLMIKFPIDKTVWSWNNWHIKTAFSSSGSQVHILIES